MKKTRLIICIMLSALCMATTSCTKHDDDDDDNSSSTTSLTGKTWRYDQGSDRTALINFSSQRFTVSATEFNHDSYETSGSYSYDGESLEFTYDGATYKVWCSVKGEAKTLAGTKWMSETTYSNGRTNTGSAEFYSNGRFRSDNFLDFCEYEEYQYSYNGQTFVVFTDWNGRTHSLECGAILYEMARKDYDNW